MDNYLLNKKDFSYKYFSDALKIVKMSRRILVWGDEDADGITSTAILVRSLRSAGKKTDYFIPSRKRDGIGITLKGLKKIQRKSFDTLITVDCGSVNSSEIEELIKRNKKVIITDHHIPHSRLVHGVPYINPHILKNEKFKHLSGAGVAFVFSVYLQNELGLCSSLKESWDFDRKNLSLTGLGTRCDRVKMNSLNSLFVSSAEKLSYHFKEIKDSGLKDEELCSAVTSSKTRITRNMMVEIFTESSNPAHKEKVKYLKICRKRAIEYKKNINRLYGRIKRKTEIKGAKKRLLIFDRQIEHKYIGVIAGRLSEELKKPVCIIGAKGRYLSGECRSVKPYDWVGVLEGYKNFFLSWGGHRQAAGFTLKGEMIEHFIDVFNTDSD